MKRKKSVKNAKTTQRAVPVGSIPLSGAEWLETDGLGGYASMPVHGPRTRRYHALLCTAARTPVARHALLKDLLFWVQTATGTWPVSTALFADGTESPRTDGRLVEFRTDPWPRWRVRLPDATEIEFEGFLVHGQSTLVLQARRVKGDGPLWLHARPLLSGRGHHRLARTDENAQLQRHDDHGFAADLGHGAPEFSMLSTGAWASEPRWWFDFALTEEAARGHDSVEDLWQPGVFSADLNQGDALFAAFGGESCQALPQDLRVYVRRARATEARRRRGFARPMERAADAFLVRRGDGLSIVAGYPWFTDYGRDTFIALRGLLHGTGRIDDATRVLLTWAALTGTDGSMPNSFHEHDGEPLLNSADAPLWFALVCAEHLKLARKRLSAKEERCLRSSALHVLRSIARGEHGLLRLEADSLLAHGTPNSQVTWMDAMHAGQALTPRTGKAVEIQALWLNALSAWKTRDRSFAKLLARGLSSFRKRFIVKGRTHLRDVVDCDHVGGADDATLRPNQILALGGLPLCLVPRKLAREMLEHIEMALLTPRGLRTLDPGDAHYRGQCVGDSAARDGAYHQGTVWPWLAGPFVEAWVTARGSSAGAKREARRRFLTPLLAHRNDPGLGHMSEIADGDEPFAARGTPFQAWSLGELLRLDRVVLK